MAIADDRIYLDHAAATPLCPEAVAALRAGEALVGNPGAIHAEGRAAATAVADARTTIARTLGVRPDAVTFTASGTEANNLALAGYLKALVASGRALSSCTVLTTQLEHPSVLAVLEELREAGLTVRFLPLLDSGRVDLSALSELLTPDVVCISCAYASSEVGVVQPVRAIARAVARQYTDATTRPVIHVDAAQAPYWLSCQCESLGADLLALDAGKCGGPKGVGVLIRRGRVALRPTVHGGGQEAGLRAGTENVAGIMAAAAAIAAAQADWAQRSERVAAVRDAGIALLPELLPEAVLNGPSGAERIANNINISLPGYDTEYATIVLDTNGVAVSTKSACAGAGGGESLAVRALTGDAARARSTLRFTLGPATSEHDLHRAFSVLAEHVAAMRWYAPGPAAIREN